MKITPNDAVNHILNSLSNTNADYWADENEVIWIVGGDCQGDSITFTFEGEDTTTQTFKLVEV